MQRTLSLNVFKMIVHEPKTSQKAIDRAIIDDLPHVDGTARWLSKELVSSFAASAFLTHFDSALQLRVKHDTNQPRWEKGTIPD